MMRPSISPLLRYTCIFALLLSYLPVEAEQSELERLWQGAMESNSELKGTEAATSSALLYRRYAATIYAPTLNLSAANSLAPPSPAKDSGTVYDYFTGSLSYRQPLTGGLTLNAAVNYEVDRVNTQDGIIAAQTPQLSIGATQSMSPWWAQGVRSDPQIARLDNAVDARRIEEMRQRRTVILQVTTDYLELRKALRTQRLLEETVEIDTETLESYKILFKQGAIENAKVWEQSQKIMDDTLALQQAIESISRLEEKIRIACNLIPSASPLEALPAGTVYRSPLDSSAMENLEWALTDQRLTATRIERVLMRQNSAPTVSIACDFSWLLNPEREEDWGRAWTDAWENKNEPRYTIRLTLDISPLFSGASKRDEAINEAQASALLAMRESNRISYERQAMQISERIHSAVAQEALCREMAEQTKKLLIDAETLASHGGITELKIDTYRNQGLKREIDAENAKDQVWYWSFLSSLWHVR